jgi:hypothetical protein
MSEDRVIKVAVVHIFGFVKYKPACPTSKLFTQLLRTDTLNARDIDLIKKLGYRVQDASTRPKEL